MKFYGDECFLEHVSDVSGYVAPEANWRVFERAWIRTLEAHDHTSGGELVPFHMADFESGFGIYAEREKWPREKKIKLIGNLIEVTNVTIGLVGFGISCRLPLSLLPSDKRTNRVPQYLACFCKILEILGKIQQLVPRERIDEMVFDRQEEMAGKIQDLTQIVEKNQKLRGIVPRIIYADKTAAVALQAADLWAYESAKEAQRSITGVPSAPRKSFMHLYKRNYVGFQYTQETFDRDVLSHFSALP